MGNDPDREKLDAMTAKIQAAEAKPEGAKPLDLATPVTAGRAGFDFAAAVLACSGLGWLIDHYLETGPWGLLGMVCMGFALGMVSVWRMLNSPEKE